MGECRSLADRPRLRGKHEVRSARTSVRGKEGESKSWKEMERWKCGGNVCVCVCFIAVAPPTPPSC